MWLSRPGIPVLIEVNETKELIDNEYFIEVLEFPFVEARLLEGLCCDRLKMSDEIKMKIGGIETMIAKLLS